MIPKISHPLLDVLIPSLGTTEKFRPMTVKEEKILLTAKEADETPSIMLSIKQVISLCSANPVFDVNKTAIFDVEWVFLQLRAASQGNVITQEYIDGEDEKTYRVNVDLNEVLPPKLPAAGNVIRIDAKTGLFMMLKWPPATLLDASFEDSYYAYPIEKCIASIGDDKQTYSIEDMKPEELQAFIDDLPIPVSEEIREFFKSVPKMKLVREYTNSLGTKRTITLETLEDFFALG